MATVVFADLVGSTGIFERLGDETAGRFVTQLTGAVSKTFEQYSGRVVKLLGDGLFVLFPGESDALAACLSIQRRLLERPLYPGGSGSRVQMQMGIESGEIVEIDGDCYGDAVNTAARLADLAGADQILTTQRVRDAVPAEQQEQLRSLGPMHLRGKTEAIEVYRFDWSTDRDVEATVMGVMLRAQPSFSALELTGAGQTVRLEPRGERITVGRSVSADLTINDSRVSRIHAELVWLNNHFVLTDVSSFGTWVYMGGADSEAVVLRRTECYLVGTGELSLGCDRDTESAPILQFTVKA